MATAALTHATPAAFACFTAVSTRQAAASDPLVADCDAFAAGIDTALEPPDTSVVGIVDQDGVQSKLVAWSWGDRRGVIPAGATIDAVVKPRLNEWRGRVSVDPEVEDLRVETPAPVAVTSPSRCPS